MLLNEKYVLNSGDLGRELSSLERQLKGIKMHLVLGLANKLEKCVVLYFIENF